MTNGSRLPRRSFLQQAAAAGCGLALHGLRSPAAAVTEIAPGATGLRAQPHGTTSTTSVVVITLPVSTDVNPRAPAWGYITEILRRGGLFFDVLPPTRLEELLRRPPCVVLLAGHLPLTVKQREVLSTWVKRGGSLVGVGGTSGLDEVFGVKGEHPLAEGWLKVKAESHPLTRGLRSSLHVFGGYTFVPSSATALANAEAGSHVAHGGAILDNRFGKGRALRLGPDLIFSIVHIQQEVG